MAGRILGFIGVGTLILIPMGLASYLFVVRGLSHAHSDITADVLTGTLRDIGGGQLEGETDYTQNHKHTFTIDKTDGRGLTDIQRGHRHVVTRNENGNIWIGAPVGALRARVPSYGEVYYLDRKGNEQSTGIDVGNEQIRKGYGLSLIHI